MMTFFAASHFLFLNFVFPFAFADTQLSRGPAVPASCYSDDSQIEYNLTPEISNTHLPRYSRWGAFGFRVAFPPQDCVQAPLARAQAGDIYIGEQKVLSWQEVRGAVAEIRTSPEDVIVLRTQGDTFIRIRRTLTGWSHEHIFRSYTSGVNSWKMARNGTLYILGNDRRFYTAVRKSFVEAGLEISDFKVSKTGAAFALAADGRLINPQGANLSKIGTGGVTDFKITESGEAVFLMNDGRLGKTRNGGWIHNMMSNPVVRFQISQSGHDVAYITRSGDLYKNSRFLISNIEKYQLLPDGHVEAVGRDGRFYRYR
jgi:hypothetical protein